MKKSLIFICTALALLLILPAFPAFADESVPDPVVIKADETLFGFTTVANCRKNLVTDDGEPYFSLEAKGRTADPYVTFSLTRYYKRAGIGSVVCDDVKYVLIKARAVSGAEGDMAQIYYNCDGAGISERHSKQSTGSFCNEWEYYVFNMTSSHGFEGTLGELRYDFINLLDEGGEFQISEIVFCYDLGQVYKLCRLDENGRKPEETTAPETFAEETAADETAPGTAADETIPETVTTAEPEVETTSDTSGGCNSSVGAALIALPLILPVLFRGKEDET